VLSPKGKAVLCPFRAVWTAPRSSTVVPADSPSAALALCRGYLASLLEEDLPAPREFASLPLPLVTEPRAAFSRCCVATAEWVTAYKQTLVAKVQARRKEAESEAASASEALERALTQHKSLLHGDRPRQAVRPPSAVWGGDSAVTRERLFGSSEEGRTERERLEDAARRRSIEEAGLHAKHVAGRLESASKQIEACKAAMILIESDLSLASSPPEGPEAGVASEAELASWARAGSIQVFF